MAESKISENELKVNAMFVLLEEQGFRTGGGLENGVGTFFQLSEAAAAECKGYAYYTAIQRDRLRYSGGTSLFIRFAALGSTSGEAVGQIILDAAIEAGLDASWLGNKNLAVELVLPGGFEV